MFKEFISSNIVGTLFDAIGFGLVIALVFCIFFVIATHNLDQNVSDVSDKLEGEPQKSTESLSLEIVLFLESLCYCSANIYMLYYWVKESKV